MAMNKKEKQALEDAELERDLLRSFQWSDAPTPITPLQAREMPIAWCRWCEVFNKMRGDEVRPYSHQGAFYATQEECLLAIRHVKVRKCAEELLAIDKKIAVLNKEATQ